MTALQARAEQLDAQYNVVEKSVAVATVTSGTVNNQTDVLSSATLAPELASKQSAQAKSTETAMTSSSVAAFVVPPSVSVPDDASLTEIRHKLRALRDCCKNEASWQGAVVSSTINDIAARFAQSSFKSYLIYVLMLDPECGL
eukprot:gene35188-43377_t